MTATDTTRPPAADGSRPGNSARVGVFGIGLATYWPQFDGLRERVGGAVDPQRAIYEIQKLKVRTTRLIEGIERLTGARPGPGLQIELRGSRTLEDAIRKAGRRIALAFAGGATLLAAVLAAAASSIDLWVPVTLGVAAGIAGVALVLDLMRGR